MKPTSKSGYILLGYISLFSFFLQLITIYIYAETISNVGSEEIQDTFLKLPEKINLNNDWWYLFEKDPVNEITTLQCVIKGGKKSIPSDLKGLVFLTVHLSLEMPSPIELMELMHIGSRYSYSFEGDYTIITIEALSKNFENTVSIISRIMKNPIFSDIRIDSLKNYMLERQKGEEDLPEFVMEKTFRDVFFGENLYGYAGSNYGDKESVKKIRRKDIVQFHKDFFNRANMTISVSSNLEKKEITRIIEKYFGSFPAGSSNEFPIVKIAEPKEKTVTISKDNRQILISLGILLPPASLENTTRAYITDEILGKGMGSKLWKLRAVDELSYNLNTRVQQMKDSGMLLVYLKTDILKKDPARDALKGIISEIREKGVSLEELDAAAEMVKADMLVYNETRTRRTSNIAFFEAIGLGYQFIETFFRQVDIVSKDKEGFDQYLKQVFAPEKIVEILVGPDNTTHE